MSKYAILGAGNGGQTFAAHLKSQGHYVHLWNRSTEILDVLKKQKKIVLNGALNLTSFPDILTTDINRAIHDVDIIFIVIPSNAHKEVAKLLAKEINPNQTIILNPGRTCGALEFREVLKRNHCTHLPLIIETQSLLYTCRMVQPGRINVYAMKKHNCIATFNENQIPNELKKELGSLYPGLKIAPNTLYTGLDNIGAILHPAPVLLNTGWIENRQSFFAHYYGGISRSIANLLEKLDQERITIAGAYDVQISSVKEWHESTYGIAGRDLYETLQNNSKYASIDAPYSIKHRYVTEDVSTGLVPLSELAKPVNIPTPTMDLIINLANTLLQCNFRETGRNMVNLGLSGKTKDEIIRCF